MLQDTINEFKKFVDLQTLQNLAAVRVTILVCESEDVQYIIRRLRKNKANGGTVAFLDGEWKQLRGKVKQKLNQISVPDLIIDIVLEKLWPISFEISKWILYHKNIGIDCSSNFCWTPQAAIDYDKTAWALIKDEALDIKKRFKLACIYSYDTKVRSLWNRMTLPERRFFFVRGKLKRSNQNQLVRYWTYCIQEVPIDYWDNKTLNETHLFKYSVENGYLRATRVFLNKIKNANLRNRMLSNCFTFYFRKLFIPNYVAREHLAIVCFIHGLYSTDNGVSSFNTLIFKYFLEWPMQKHFLTVVNRLRNRLKDRNFGEVLVAILEKDIGGFKDHDYKELFKEFWHQSPLQYKTYVGTGSRFGYKIFMKFVKTHFGFVFEENSFRMKAKFRAIVFQQEISENGTYLEKENVDFFKFLVQESVIIKSSIERFSRRRDDDFMMVPFLGLQTYFNLPLGELMYLIDGILGSV